MTAEQIGNNIVAYVLQIGLVVGLGSSVPALLRMRVPRIRLLYWQVLLVACLALPWVRAWRQEIVVDAAQVGSVVMAYAATSPSAPIHSQIPWTQLGLAVLLAGIAIRLGCLALGLSRLAVYRRRGQTMPPQPGVSGVTLLLSDDVSGPVTFGWRDPVVLLPAGFPSLDEDMREAILCHELLHVDRRDWLFTIGEELVRSLLWFHPAIWWVIGEVQLAREQTVDQAVIEITHVHGPYVDALLLMAGAGDTDMPQLDLAPAPMFLRRRHLKRRLTELIEGVPMIQTSRIRLACISGAAALMLTALCWLATGAFPLTAAPQQAVNDAVGVTVNTNGTPLMHRSSVPYSAEALAKGVEGMVAVQVRIDAAGEVSDATVVSGPEELRKGVLQSVLTWHFDKAAAYSTRVVNIYFVKPAAGAQTTVAQFVPIQAATGKLARILVSGLSDQTRDALLAQLPFQAGVEWSQRVFDAMTVSVRNFDSHLKTTVFKSKDGAIALLISPASSSVNTNAIYNVGDGVTQPQLIRKVDPQYSEEARAAKYNGSVTLSAVVGVDGRPEDIQVVKGIGMGLDEKAVEAAQQWVFAPGTLQGVPVKVRATLEVNFRLVSLPVPVDGTSVHTVGNGVSQPQLISKVDPQYSEEARKAKYNGSVTLSVVVGTDGRAEDIQVTRGLGMGLDEKAIEAVQQWVFRPGTLQGSPVRTRAVLEVNFRLL